jgi:hypothetical protein
MSPVATPVSIIADMMVLGPKRAAKQPQGHVWTLGILARPMPEQRARAACQSARMVYRSYGTIGDPQRGCRCTYMLVTGVRALWKSSKHHIPKLSCRTEFRSQNREHQQSLPCAGGASC